MSLFGAPAAQPAQQTGGLFGNPQPQQQATGGLFGGAQSTTGGSSLFGNPQNQQTNQAAPATGTGGGLFGQSTGGSLFGQQPQQQQQTGGGLFGTNNAAASTPGGLLGQSSNTQQQGTGTSLFGNTQQGGLFGAKPPGTTGTLFGNQQQQQQPGTSLFGGGTGGTSLFGNTQQNQQPTNNLFGPKPNTFGATGGGFGQSAQGQPQANQFFDGGNTSLFGTSTLGTSTLGRNTLGLPTAGQSTLKTPPTPIRPDNDPQSQNAKYQQKLQEIFLAWSPQSPDCRFQHYFYNLVDPSQVQNYGRPANALNDATWEKAVKENPDPTCFVPVPAIGFDDLRQRADAQTQMANDHQQRLKDLQSRLKALNEKHTLSNIARLRKASAQHIQITQRLLHFVQHLHLLLPAVRSTPIRPEEENLRARLEEVEEEVRRGRLKGKMNELWAIIGAIRASKERERGHTPNGGKDGEWVVVDEDGLAQLSNALAQQQTALQYLMKTVKQQQRDTRIIMGEGPSDVSDTDVLYNLPSMYTS
ncbi:nucleoporin complex subunit 54-domain-containing protein [Flagelloscypha sp. PMI_526]|nr:nucleoporin complex subunit 54-domain-containing protein [Flagelloscypha sp. PMI_526]